MTSIVVTPARAQRRGDRLLPQLDRSPRPPEEVERADEDVVARRHARQRTGVVLREAHARAREAIEVRRVELVAAVAAEQCRFRLSSRTTMTFFGAACWWWRLFVHRAHSIARRGGYVRRRAGRPWAPPIGCSCLGPQVDGRSERFQLGGTSGVIEFLVKPIRPDSPGRSASKSNSLAQASSCRQDRKRSCEPLSWYQRRAQLRPRFSPRCPPLVGPNRTPRNSAMSLMVSADLSRNCCRSAACRGFPTRRFSAHRD